MKKFTLIIVVFFATNVLHAQNVENPSFDSAYIGGIDRIYAWITSDAWSFSMNDTVYPLDPDSHYVSFGLNYHELLRTVQLEYSNPFHGSLAIQLLADTSRVDIFGNPFRGFIVNGDHFYTNSDGYIDFSKCGTPFPYRPDKMRGHYIFEDNAPSLNNYPNAFLLLKKYNTTTQQSDTIGYGFPSMLLYPTPNWQLFEMPITYVSNLTPDSIVVGFLGSRLAYTSSFKVDSLGFEYSSPVTIEDPQESAEIPYFLVGNTLHFQEPEAISSLQIFDYLGKEVISSKSGMGTDLSELSSGTYLISVELKTGLHHNFRIYR